MKKTYFLFLLLAMPVLCFAQFNAANKNAVKSHIGLRAGIGISTYNLDDSRALVMPLVGLAFDYKIASIPLYFDSGVYYMDLGTGFKDFKYPYHMVSTQYPNGRPEDKTTHTLHNHSLMIPAGVSYHLYLSNKIVLQPFSGIYLSYGITNEKIDLGLREGVGMSFGKFYTNFGVNFGLIRQTGKVKVDYDYDIVVEKCLQSSAFLSIGYNF